MHNACFMYYIATDNDRLNVDDNINSTCNNATNDLFVALTVSIALGFKWRDLCNENLCAIRL